MDIRAIEKTSFREIMEKVGFSWAKGIHHAGSTDSNVSSNEYVVYVSIIFYGYIENL